MRHMQTVNALLHLQRVCSLSYLHLLCISTLELGINCFVANDVGYNYLALEWQTLSKSWVQSRREAAQDDKLSLNCPELKLLLLRNRVANWDPLQSSR